MPDDTQTQPHITTNTDVAVADSPKTSMHSWIAEGWRSQGLFFKETGAHIQLPISAHVLSDVVRQTVQTRPLTHIHNSKLTFLYVSWQVSLVRHHWHDSRSRQQPPVLTFREEYIKINTIKSFIQLSICPSCIHFLFPLSCAGLWGVGVYLRTRCLANWREYNTYCMCLGKTFEPWTDLKFTLLVSIGQLFDVWGSLCVFKDTDLCIKLSHMGGPSRVCWMKLIYAVFLWLQRSRCQFTDCVQILSSGFYFPSETSVSSFL